MSLGTMDLPRYSPVVEVRTTSNRGFTSEEHAKRCAEKIISVSDNAPAPIREQARAFQQVVEKVVLFYIQQVRFLFL